MGNTWGARRVTVAVVGVLVVAAYATLLAVVVLGAPATFASGFALGMDVADGFGVGGAAHTVWAGVRYLTSGIALVAVPVVLVVGLTRSARRTAAPARPA